MSGFIKPLRNARSKYLPKEIEKGDIAHQGVTAIGKGTDKVMNPKMPEIPETPAAPTIDDAQRNRDQQDRLRRRRGVLANIFAGGKSTLG